ncbi:MAG: prepilin-type N-terminal cleavage/methylation domain-containing protein [Proteobacteria bacterium]|nr:prepilin-type N-terminal cleavage/methylation domain-containing protein [Pseudomonadota bacterium]
MRGFTLIELLVVLVILGIMTTAVALSITTDPGRAVTSDVKRLSLLLEAAMIEAQAGRRQLAWSADAAGYEFWEAESSNERERHWLPLTADERFQSHRFAAGLHLVRLENEGLALPQGALLVFRRGDPPLFRIALESSGKQPGQAETIELRGLPTGRVEILGAAER